MDSSSSFCVSSLSITVYYAKEHKHLVVCVQGASMKENTCRSFCKVSIYFSLILTKTGTVDKFNKTSQY
jgi:hypothetical protein